MLHVVFYLINCSLSNSLFSSRNLSDCAAVGNDRRKSRRVILFMRQTATTQPMSASLLSQSWSLLSQQRHLGNRARLPLQAGGDGDDAGGDPARAAAGAEGAAAGAERRRRGAAPCHVGHHPREHGPGRHRHVRQVRGRGVCVIGRGVSRWICTKQG